MSEQRPNELKLSKGPWRLEKCRCGHPVCSRYGLSNGVFYQGSGFEEPDATAIAAVPEMVAALRRSLSWLSSYPGGNAEGAYMAVVDALKKAGCYE